MFWFYNSKTLSFIISCPQLYSYAAKRSTWLNSMDSIYNAHLTRSHTIKRGGGRLPPRGPSCVCVCVYLVVLLCFLGAQKTTIPNTYEWCVGGRVSLWCMGWKLLYIEKVIRQGKVLLNHCAMRSVVLRKLCDCWCAKQWKDEIFRGMSSAARRRSAIALFDAYFTHFPYIFSPSAQRGLYRLLHIFAYVC